MVCIEKRPYTLYGRLATLHFRYLTCLLDRGHIITASDCFFSHLYYLLKSSIPFPMWWGWYRQVVPLACQLVKNKIRVPSGTLILFPPHCLRHRCYLLMGYAPETPRQKDTPSTKGMVCLSVFTAIVPGNVADVYLDNWIDYHRLYPSCFYPHYKTIEFFL